MPATRLPQAACRPSATDSFLKEGFSSFLLFFLFSFTTSTFLQLLLLDVLFVFLLLFWFCLFVRKFISCTQLKSLRVTMANSPCFDLHRRRHGWSIETSTHRESLTTSTEPFLVGLLSTSYPHSANYKTIATVYLFLKSDKKMTEIEARKDDQVTSHNDRIWKKGVVLVRKYLWLVRLCPRTTSGKSMWLRSGSHCLRSLSSFKE